jgi:hypothetical protein
MDQHDKYLEAAAECFELARSTREEQTRVCLLTLAQKWAHLARYRLDAKALLAAIEDFNQSRTR